MSAKKTLTEEQKAAKVAKAAAKKAAKQAAKNPPAPAPTEPTATETPIAEPTTEPTSPVDTGSVDLPATPNGAKVSNSYEARTERLNPLPKPPEPGTTLSAAMVFYDVPSNSEMSNPSWFFRRRGFRVNLSCWIMPEAAIPEQFIHEMRTKHGADVGIMKFDASEGPAIVKRAVMEGKKEIALQIKRSKEALERAEEKLRLDPELEANMVAREEAQEAYENAGKHALKRLETMVLDIATAMQNFGIDKRNLNLKDAVSAYSSMMVGYDAKIKAFVTATAELKAKNTLEGNALANAAADGNVPAGPLADMLRDLGDDAAADALTEAYNPAPEETVEEPEVVNADGEYSLADVA